MNRTLYVIMALYGLFLSPTQADVPIQQITTLPADLPAAKKLQRHLSTRLGQPATEAELGHLADLVVDHLKQHHWPVSLVTVWDEDGGLEDGKVTLQVQQGKVGDIAIVGGSERRQRSVAKRVAKLTQNPLQELTLQRHLDALAFSPWLAVAPSAVPGATMDTANLVLTLKDESPFHAFASYDNNGVQPLGRDRYTLGTQWLNAFALGHDLTLSASIADDPETLAMLAGNWRIPLPWRHELRLNGYYAESNSTADILGIPLDIAGTTWMAGSRYIIPYRINKRWRSEWQLGFDLKQFDTAFTFGSAALLDGTVGVGTLVIGTQWFYEGEQTKARIAVEASHGEPGWAKGQEAHEFNDLVPGADPRFTTLRADATLQHDFRNQIQAALRLGGQWSDGPVLPSEALALASSTTVRGYPERSILASQGAWASLETRSPAWTLLKALQFKLRALAFADAGYIADPTLASSDFIASAGIGLASEVTKHLQIRADLAFPLLNSPEEDYRIHLTAVLRF